MASAPRPRARDLGIPFDGAPGPLNAITDVDGIEVGHRTLIADEEGPDGVRAVRTGVTAILPRGLCDASPVFAGWHRLNGNGEMTGTAWIDESGLLAGPVMLTNTHSVGVVRDTVIAFQVRAGRKPGPWSLPVVAETYDGRLNDTDGFHVKPEHVLEALDNAADGPVAEGNVGGGTGMVCHGFKGGIGTASRIAADPRDRSASRRIVGALVQANHGTRAQLRIAGVPVGAELAAHDVRSDLSGAGSIIVVLATDAPLLPHQCRALAQRAGLGIARLGAVGGITSGDLFLAFSTGNTLPADASSDVLVTMCGLALLDTLFEAAVQATEEAIVNALVAAETMTGADGRTVDALPHDRLRDTLRRYGRLA